MGVKRLDEGGYWDLEDAFTTTNEVYEEDKDLFTGLLNSKGEPLYRQKEPIGFRLKKG